MKLSEEAREKRNAYMSEYRRKNKDKEKEYQARYWEKRARVMEKEAVNE